MKVTDFYNKIEKHEELEGMGVNEDNAEVIIKHKVSGVKTRLSVETITECNWDDIAAVLTCNRDAHALTHMSRVVGYYSMINNWNKSKIGELKDRQNGIYAIGG